MKGKFIIQLMQCLFVVIVYWKWNKYVKKSLSSQGLIYYKTMLPYCLKWKTYNDSKNTKAIKTSNEK